MRLSFYTLFSFLLFLHQSFIFTQVVWSHENWSVVEIRSFSKALKAVGVSDESISILIEVTDYLQIQKISSFFQNLEVDQQESENSTAADEFSDYVFKRDVDVDAVMGEDWVDELMENTKGWTPIEANHFISFLKSEGLESDSILMILKATDYLRVIRANQVAVILKEETVAQASTEAVQVQQAEEVSHQTQTASDIFIRFAREQFKTELEQEGNFLEGEEFEEAFKKRMGRKGQWEKDIAEATERLKWNVNDARGFLRFSREKIGDHATLRAIKITSFFSNTNYENFQLRVDIFSEYVDAERMKEQLQDCLTCFTKGIAHTIRSVIETVRDYFGEEGETIVKQALNNNVRVFSLSENQSKVLGELLHFLGSYIGKEGVKDIILNKPASFMMFRLKRDPHSEMYILQMPLVVAYIESYFEDANIGKTVVQEIMQNSFQGLARAEIKKLEAVVGYIEGYVDKVVVQKLMKDSFYGLAMAEVNKLEAVVKYIEGYFKNRKAGRKVVQELMQNSFKGLALAEVEKLKNVVEYVEGYVGKVATRKIMQNSFKGLAMAEVKKLEAVVKYIEGYFENRKVGKEVVQGIMKNSFYGLALAEVKKLEAVVRYVEGYVGKEVTQELMKNNFQSLAVAEVKKLEAVVRYIEDYAGKAATQKLMKKSFTGLALAEVKKLEAVVRYIEVYVGKEAVQKLMQKSFKGLARAEVKKLKDVVEYVEGYAGKEVVQKIIRKSFQGLAVAEVEKIKAIVRYIESYFESADAGKAVVQELMKDSFTGLTRAEVKKLKDVVKYIESYFEEGGKAVVQELIQKSFQGLALAEVEKLKNVVEYIEGYAGKAATQEIMRNSFYGLALVEVAKLRDVVGYIEKYIEAASEKETAIKQIMTFVSLFSQESYFDESKTKSFIFDKLNDLLKSIDGSIGSQEYDMETRERWKAGLQDIFLDFSIERLQSLHRDINENICGEKLS